MKKIKYLILLIIPFVFFSSCKKNKEPEKQEKHFTEIIVEPLQDLSIGETSELKITKIPEDAIEEIIITVSDNNLISIENNIIQCFLNQSCKISYI
jgi:PBP1b-binding outer membrane lipoprotein LpoB